MRDNSDGSGEKILIEVAGGIVEVNIKFGHILIGDSDRNGTTLAIAFESEKFSNCLGIGGIGAKSIASFGGIDDKVALLKFFDGGLDDGLSVGSS